MNTDVLLAILGASLALNAGTFWYVVRIERRITRLETLEQVRGVLPCVSSARANTAAGAMA